MTWGLCYMGWASQTVDRARLSRAAVRYAGHGWDVVPGAAFTGNRFRCDDHGCPTVGCHPATGFWQATATHDLPTIEAWWRHTPYAVLLPTGRCFDVIEVAAPLGAWMLAKGALGPVAVASSRRWMFLVAPGDPLRPEVADRIDVVLHGPGSWVAAPPTREPGGRARWKVSPDEVDWRLPRSYAVQELLLGVLSPGLEPRAWTPRAA